MVCWAARYYNRCNFKVFDPDRADYDLIGRNRVKRVTGPA
jgi:hypothetical protein